MKWVIFTSLKGRNKISPMVVEISLLNTKGCGNAIPVRYEEISPFNNPYWSTQYIQESNVNDIFVRCTIDVLFLKCCFLTQKYILSVKYLIQGSILLLVYVVFNVHTTNYNLFMLKQISIWWCIFHLWCYTTFKNLRLKLYYIDKTKYWYFLNYLCFDA